MHLIGKLQVFFLLLLTGVFSTASATSLLYSVDDLYGQLVMIDRTAEDAEVVVEGLPRMSSLVYDSSVDTLFGVSYDQLLAFNRHTGQVTTVGSLDSRDSTTVFGLAYDSSADVLFGVDMRTQQLLTIDRSTADVTVVGALGGIGAVDALTYDSSTDTLLGIANGSDLISINRETGAATLLMELDGIEGRYGLEGTLKNLAYDPARDVLLGIEYGYGGLVSIDKETGEIIERDFLDYTYGHVDGLGRTTGLTVVTAVPVPAAIWFYVSALGLLGWLRRRAT